MAEEKERHGHALKLNHVGKHQAFEYMLLRNENDTSQKFDPITPGDEINIDAHHNVFVLRYGYKPNMTVGFQIEEITGDVRLIARQFRTEKDKGINWCVNVFTIEKSRKKSRPGHDSDIDPPEPPIPS